ncbi:hypothetical protein ANTPLA_LOCUS10293 [Anthophora plagiata]
MPSSMSRLCPLPWEFAERKCNFWQWVHQPSSWPASIEKRFFKKRRQVHRAVFSRQLGDSLFREIVILVESRV